MYRFLRIVTLVLTGVGAASAGIKEQARVDFFFSAGCTECERVRRHLFPQLEARFAGDYELFNHDLAQAETIPLLIAYQDRCGNGQNESVSLVVDHTTMLAGYDAIAAGLLPSVKKAVEARRAADWQIPKSPLDEDNVGSQEAVVAARANNLTISVVALGGLLDGFNPCAISTLIFFMSVLVVTKTTRRVRLLVGLSFITASFVVYTSLGLGFLYAFRQAPNFTVTKRIVEVVLGLCMIPLATLSLRDSIRFRASQRPTDVTLQIPTRIKSRIHRFMNSRLGWGGPIIGGLVTGAGVTILESVCTGQSYVPVLMYMLKQQCSPLWFGLLLIIYNLLFVLPLAVVFVLFHQGLELKSLIHWSRRNLVVVKIFMGIFFAAMALLLLWPR